VSITIREFTDTDYSVVTDIWNAARPCDPRIEGAFRFADIHRDARCKHRRWVAEDRGVVVAWAEYLQHPEDYHPRKFAVNILVLPEFQKQGIGTALYEYVVAALETLDPIGIYFWVREDMLRSIRFLIDRGYTESMREWASYLDLTTFNPATYDGIVAEVRDAGVEIKTLSEIEDDKDYVPQLIDLEYAIERDVPGSDEPLKQTEEHFSSAKLHSPALLPEAYVVAVADGEYVGMTNLWKHDPNDPDTFVETGLTGVRRDYRRRGIALAMKVQVLRWAKENGYKEVRTENEINNPMFTINERLGFVKDPAWIQFAKALKAE
jgi:mycothiol synthase